MSRTDPVYPLANAPQQTDMGSGWRLSEDSVAFRSILNISLPLVLIGLLSYMTLVDQSYCSKPSIIELCRLSPRNRVNRFVPFCWDENDLWHVHSVRRKPWSFPIDKQMFKTIQMYTVHIILYSVEFLPKPSRRLTHHPYISKRFVTFFGYSYLFNRTIVLRYIHNSKIEIYKSIFRNSKFEFRIYGF
jgi:hypothetical protein